jgi:membrane-associated phospholipid phosphatase
MPLIDPLLAQADAAVGLTSPAYLSWLAGHPLVVQALDLVYVSAAPAVFVVIPLLMLTGQIWRLWELAFTFAVTVLATTLIATFFPAIGAVIYCKIGPTILAHLPPGVGRLYVPTFEAFRSGAVQTIDINHLDGVIQFPSFHTVMALLIANAWRRLPGASLVAAWSALVIASAVPFGGHYFTDLVAGGAIWAAVAAAAHLRCASAVVQRRSPQPESVAPRSAAWEQSSASATVTRAVRDDHRRQSKCAKMGWRDRTRASARTAELGANWPIPRDSGVR